MNISIIGSGYVGLVTGACFAELGNRVICADNDIKKIACLKKGIIPIYEPGLEELVAHNVKRKRLRFSSSIKDAVKNSEIIFIAVGTPSLENGEADLTGIENVARNIAMNMTSYRLIVEKSTVPVETGEWLKRTISTYHACRQAGIKRKIEFDVASNPEFLREGQAINDFMHPDRIVIGVESKRAKEILTNLYKPLNAPIVTTNIKSAELIKHASNAFLANKISFINAISRICDKVGADVKEVADGMGLDKRIGRAFLDAGIGYGGSCLAGTEKIIIRNKNKEIIPITLEDFFNKFAENHSFYEVLNFDYKNKRLMFDPVRLITKRKYSGEFIRIITRMNKVLNVTYDHPFIVYKNGKFKFSLAANLKIKDQLPIFLNMPPQKFPQRQIDLIENLKNFPELLKITKVRPADDKEFINFKKTFLGTLKEANVDKKRNINSRLYDICRNNSMTLEEYILIEERDKMPIPRKDIMLFTALGSPTYIKATIDIDTSFFKLLGYFVSEGNINFDKGERSTRARVNFHFNENEKDYINEVTHILRQWGLRYGILHQENNHTISIIVSSKLFAFLLKDVLACGIGSYTAKVPPLVFSSDKEQKLSFLQATFRGDGYIAFPKNSNAVVYDYGSISKNLIHDLVLLFHSIGIIPSYETSISKKSTGTAHFFRISGRQQIRQLVNFKNIEVQNKIKNRLDNYRKIISPTGFKNIGNNFALVTIKDIRSYHKSDNVYSLETFKHHTFVSSFGLIVHNCFPKDVDAFIKISEKLGYDFALLKAVKNINEGQKDFILKKLKDVLWILKDKTIGVLGLSFKPNTDDIRNAPSLDLINALQTEGAKIKVYDPQAMEKAKGILRQVRFCQDPYGVCRGSDCLLIVTEWDEFKELDFAKVKKLLKRPFIIDGRNIYEPQRLKKQGFTYISIGRKAHE